MQLQWVSYMQDLEFAVTVVILLRSLVETWSKKTSNDNGRRKDAMTSMRAALRIGSEWARR